MVRFYCEVCDEHKCVLIEPLETDELNKGKPPWGDIVCVECHFVIATISADIPGIYKFSREVSNE
jgi:hypothetical protein